jgi:hypothetical protein
MKHFAILLIYLIVLSACQSNNPEPVTSTAPELVDLSEFNGLMEDQSLLMMNAKMGLTKVPAGPAPFWARVLWGFPQGMPETEDFGIIYFYVQDVNDVTPGFNLLNFMDFAALGSARCTEGSEWYLDAYNFPYMTKLRENGAVPFWIITSDQVAAVYSDGEITMNELNSLNPAPAKGYATKFKELLWVEGGGAPIPAIITLAEGIIEDGNGILSEGQEFRFYLHYIFLKDSKTKLSVELELF